MNGPQPLRLPHGKLFFGYELKPVRKDGEKKVEDDSTPRFQGQGHSLRGSKKKDPADEGKGKGKKRADTAGKDRQNLGTGRTLKDAK